MTPRRWIAAVTIGVALAAVLATTSALTDPDQSPRMALFLGACMLPAAIIVGWIAARPAPPNDEQNVETIWTHRARAGAMTDLLLTLGVALVVLGVSGWEYQIDLVVAAAAVVAFGVSDSTARFYLLRHKEG